ncbi:MAG: HNH endonuclease [Cocleimonas sp.]
MKNCYKCKHNFDDVNVKKHEEHIIQNALGGKLTSFDILCLQCGGELGQSIDNPFIESLSQISTLLDLARDRGAPGKASVDVIMKEGSVFIDDSVTYEIKNDFTIIPSKPIYTVNDAEKKVILFGSSVKQLKQFQKSKNILNYIELGYSTEISIDLALHIEKATINCNFNSPENNYGVLKIAIGFALENNISLQYLEDVIELLSVDAKEGLEDKVWQYYPTSDEEKLYETGKSIHEDWYPNHQLYLFNKGQKLYCYVELFGVLQKYVLLSSTYRGKDVCEKYIQKIIRWVFNEDEWKPRRIGDWHALAQQFDVPFDLKSFKKMEDMILQRARSMSYKIEPDSQIEKVSNLLQQLAIYTISEVKGHLMVDALHSKAELAKSNMEFSLVDKLKSDPLVAFQLINKDFSFFRIGEGSLCCPTESKLVSESDKVKYRSYKVFDFLSSLKAGKDISFIAL